MSLLREIQGAAIDAKIPLSTLLRKCKVLAARLGNEDFKRWVDSELSGYRNADNIPDYRRLEVNSKGHFSGPFNSGLRNVDIPLGCVPEKYREKLSNSHLVEPVASLEALVEKSEGGTAQEPWNPNLVALVGRDIYHGMNCMQAWKVIPITAVIEALEAVRNRILSFVLEIEAQAPNAGEAPANSNPLPPEQVHQIFNTYITGNVQNVATGGRNFEQNATIGEQHSTVFAELLEALSNVSEELEAARRLSGIVEEMRDSKTSMQFKDRYTQFMSVLADHIQVFGPIVAPYLPALVAVLA